MAMETTDATTREWSRFSIAVFSSGSIVIELNEQKGIGAPRRRSSSARLVTRNGVDFAWRPPGNDRCGTLARRSGKRQAENSFFFLFCLLLLPPSFFLASLDSLQALESVLALNSWLECLEECRSVYLLSVRYVVRLVNSVSILDRVPKNLPRGPSSPQ